MMEVPTVQEKSKHIFFVQPMAHQFKFAYTNKTVPMDPLKLITFFKPCQVADKVAGILEKIAKDKRQPKESKTAHLPMARSRESSYQQHLYHKYKPIGPAALLHMDRQTVSSIYYYCYVCTYVVRIMYDT
jgi:hypothetical protein